MIEQHADLWEVGDSCDATCITTNGTVTGRGLGVLGRGCALEATYRYPKLQRTMGGLLRHYGNHARIVIRQPGYQTLVAVPVKHEWMERADLELITRSLRELVQIADGYQWARVVLPRPGCGNGGLDWEGQADGDGGVKAVCLSLLDDRFIVVHK